MEPRELAVPIPTALIDQVAERAAEVILERMSQELRPPAAGWMKTNEAAAYLGMTRGALYGRVADIPHYKFERMLLFKRRDLDAWMESHRQEPRSPQPEFRASARPAPVTRRRSSRTASGAELLPIGGKRSAREPKPRKKRERPLPPPLSGDEEQKQHWAEQLEISREELDDMSPGEFKKAWAARDQRLRDGGVYDHLDEIGEHFGWNEFHLQTPRVLIEFVKGLAKSGAKSAGSEQDPGSPPPRPRRRHPCVALLSTWKVKVLGLRSQVGGGECVGSRTVGAFS